MKALLVRVGIDSSEKSGGWNAPVDPVTREFAYVPILERGEVIPEYKRTYEQFEAICKKLGNPLPPKFMKNNTYAHLDPDFSNLTYGDEGKRGERVRELKEDDIVAFYAGLRSTEPERNLIYALIGLYVVNKIIPANSISEKDRDKNAHTRKQPDKPDKPDVIVFAKSGLSGRLERCIPIGEYRSKAYRVTCGLLGEWGGLCVKNGFIQLSGTLPWFCNPEKFYKWFRNPNNRLVECNNPLATGD